MRIARGLVLSPGINAVFAVPAVTVSMFVFAYSTLYGQLPILVLYAVWALPLVFEPRILLRHVPLVLAMSAFAALAIVSTLWSGNASATLRGGIQYASTIACAVIAARILTMRMLALGGLSGITLVLAMSLQNGHYQYNVLDGSYALVGLFGSKNQLGFYASLGVMFALFLLAARRASAVVRASAAAVLAVSLYSLVQSQSATSIITVAAATGLALVLTVAGRLRPTQRLVAGVAAGSMFAAASAIAIDAGAFESVLGAFGKDPTLTGRTYLWQEGVRAASENPVVGGGYNAFWTHGFPWAERLWEEFYISSRTGFHFHNTYIKAAVDTGLVGLSLLLFIIAWFCGAAVRAALAPRIDLETVLVIAVGALLISRSFVEIDFLQPYTVGTFLFYFCFMRLMERSTISGARPASRAIRMPADARPSLAAP